MSRIRSPGIFCNPYFDVGDLRPLISRGSLDGRELSEADPKAHVVGILLGDDIVRRTWCRWILKEFE